MYSQISLILWGPWICIWNLIIRLWWIMVRADLTNLMFVGLKQEVDLISPAKLKKSSFVCPFNLFPLLPTLFLFFPECSYSAIADVAFLVDGSWSVGRPNFKYIQKFISATAGAFQVGEDKTRVAVVQYSNDAKAEFNLNTHMTRPALLRAIGSLAYKGGDTMTGTRLKCLFEFFTLFCSLAQ